MKQKTLKLKEFNEYVDIDGMLHSLCIQLGIIPEDSLFSTEAKGIYWSNNPLGNFLGDTLYAMKALGIILENEEEQTFKWNPDYVDPVSRHRLDNPDRARCPDCDGPSGYDPSGSTCRYCGSKVLSNAELEKL